MPESLLGLGAYPPLERTGTITPQHGDADGTPGFGATGEKGGQVHAAA